MENCLGIVILKTDKINYFRRGSKLLLPLIALRMTLPSPRTCLPLRIRGRSEVEEKSMCYPEHLLLYFSYTISQSMLLLKMKSLFKALTCWAIYWSLLEATSRAKPYRQRQRLRVDPLPQLSFIFRTVYLQNQFIYQSLYRLKSAHSVHS